MPILLWLFCALVLLAAASFICSVCFGKPHTLPEGYEYQGGEQSEPNPGESVTEVMEKHSYAKQLQFSNN